VALEVFTAIGAMPVGLMFLIDPTGGLIRMQPGWIEGTVFGSYFVPGLYLLFVNGLGMLVAALLTVRRHPTAPWLTGALGVGLIIWILVEILVLPLTMFLTWIFLATGLALGFIALFWLRRTGQLRLW
jgi:glucose dehydrogenase